MNKEPVYYMQIDPRWSNKPYAVTGETSTIGSAGCGPSCAAMLISTLTGKTFTPLDAAKWSLSHGYKALNQGTYYSYFKPQFAAFGLECTQLNSMNSYHNPNHENHKTIRELLKNGYYIIALMNPGHWTKAGHFVVVWGCDSVVHILDPASNSWSRSHGNPDVFFNEVKYYWIVKGAEYIEEKEEEEEMTQAEFNKMADIYFAEKQKSAAGDYSKDARAWAERNGIITGDVNGNKMYKAFCTREQLMVFLYRFTKLIKKELQ